MGLKQLITRFNTFYWGWVCGVIVGGITTLVCIHFGLI